MYEIDEFGCFILPKHELDLVRAYRYYRTAIICAEEITDELEYEEEERYFNLETYVRWYEAIEKAVVIWLYELGIQVSSGMLDGRYRGYHEAFLYTLSHPDNPFFEIFRQCNLLPGLHVDKDLRNRWRHDNQPILNPFEDWDCLARYLSVVNAALGDALDTFGEMRADAREIRATLRNVKALEKMDLATRESVVRVMSQITSGFYRVPWRQERFSKGFGIARNH